MGRSTRVPPMERLRNDGSLSPDRWLIEAQIIQNRSDFTSGRFFLLGEFFTAPHCKGKEFHV